MFKHVRKEIMNNIISKEFAERYEGTYLNSKIDPSILYYESLTSGNLDMVKILVVFHNISVDRRYRFDKTKRTGSDLIPLVYAIQTYKFDLAELLISLHHPIKDLVVKLDKSDTEGVFVESYRDAIKFCEKYNIAYEEI